MAENGINIGRLWTGYTQFGQGLSTALTYGAASTLAEAKASAYLAQSKAASTAYLDEAAAAVRNMGIAQQQGVDAATLRYEQLGREIASQRVAAAGSGIDVSSRTLGKVESTSRKNAAWDVEHLSRQAKIAADNYNSQAEAAYRNSAFARIQGDYQAQTAMIQGELQDKNNLYSGILGMFTGGINILGTFLGGETAGNSETGYGGKS